MKFVVREVKAKSILSKSGLPGADWVVNPYIGCRFGCKYCYAAFVGRFSHSHEEWGSYVDAKVNAPVLLRNELRKKLKGKKKKDIGTILFSSVTDPYQGIEAKYQLTRQCLLVLKEMKYQGLVSILTKSNLVTRDIDIFRELTQVEVGLTVTSTGDPITQYLEQFAPLNETRLEALKRLKLADISTYAFIGPLLPHFVWQKAELEKLFVKLKQAGVTHIYLEHINLAKNIRERLFRLGRNCPELKKFRKAQLPAYRLKLDKLLEGLVASVGLEVVYSKPIYHQDKKSWQSLQEENQT